MSSSDRALDLAQRLALGLLRGQRGAELRLVAGAAQEQHEVAGDREGRVAVEVFLDERQREVHAGGHARPRSRSVRRARRSARGRRARRDAGAAAPPPTPSAWSRGARRAGRRGRAGRRRCTPRRCVWPRSEASAIQSTSARSAAASAWPGPPATISVSIGSGASRRPRVGSDGQAARGAQRRAVAAEHAHLDSRARCDPPPRSGAARRRTPRAGRSRRGSARPG